MGDRGPELNFKSGKVVKNELEKYQVLVTGIRDTVRKKAPAIPKFQKSGNGAVRILLYPLCKEADEWLGRLSSFRKTNMFDGDSRGVDDIVDYEFTFAITPGGSRIITYVQDGKKQKCDCYAYSASKIAHCSLAQDQGVGLISGLKLEGDYLEEANGYAAHLGAICVEVEGYCDVYVCVSGAKQEEDLECAKEAIKVIVDFFNNQGKLKINVPVFLTEGGER